MSKTKLKDGGKNSDKKAVKRRNILPILDCIICSKTFKFKSLLEDHIGRLHLRERAFACPTCKKCFATKRNLSRHKVSHGSSRFACSKCSTTCKSTTQLKRHIKYVHDKKNHLKMKCPEQGCNHKFLFQSLLKLHLKSHQDLVSRRLEFECADCGMWWERREGYQKHMKIHHNPERPTSQCGYCRLIFGSEELLHQHKIEKGHDKPKLYNCGYCRLQFSNRSKLQRHRTRPTHAKMVEEDEKLNNLEGFRRTLVTLNLTVDPVFPCNACESSYNTEEELAQHKQMLHYKQPKATEFKCEENGCGRGFKKKCNLKRHVETVHNKEKYGDKRLKAKVGLVTHTCGQLKGKRQPAERKSNKKVQEKSNKSLQPEKPTRSQPTRTSARLRPEIEQD